MPIDEQLVAHLRQEIVDSCLILAANGCVREVTGHVSARLPGTDEMLLRCRRPNDPGVEFTVLDDVRRSNIDGRGWAVVDGYELPGEFAIHSEIYRRRPDVSAVVHGHPHASLICGIVNLPLAPIVGAYDIGMLEVAASPLAVFPKGVLIRTPELGRQLAETMMTANACLLQGHGIVTVGASVPEATMRAVKLEGLAALVLAVHATGREPKLLSPDEIEETLRAWRPRASEFVRWTWEFHRRKLTP